MTDDFAFSTLLLKQARAAKFNNFLKPGQTLNVTAKLKKNEHDVASFQAAGTVEGVSAVSARLILSKRNLQDQRPDMAEIDGRVQAAMKEMFEQIRPDYDAV